MVRNIVTDSRRLANAVDRLDAVSATDRQIAAKHVYDVCVYHVARVRKTHPAPPQPQQQSLPTSINSAHSRGRGRSSPVNANIPQVTSNTSSTSVTSLSPSPQFVFDVVHPHVYRIARRLDRAMRYAESSPHPADAAALIGAVDAQGALAALFAVAQNAGVSSTELDILAAPLRKRSAPALLRTLFSPDMRVANAAKKALRQVITIASCQNSSWMSTIRSALSLRTATRVNRSIQLRNLLTRLAEILHLVIRQAAASRASAAAANIAVVARRDATNAIQQQYQQQYQNYPAMVGSGSGVRKRASKVSISSMVMGRPRPSLTSERRAAERYAESAGGSERMSLRDLFKRRSDKAFIRSASPLTLDTDGGSERLTKRRFNNTHSHHRKPADLSSLAAFSPHPTTTPDPFFHPMTNAEDWHSVASGGVLSTGGVSYPGSVFSSITESGTSTVSPSIQQPHQIHPRHNASNQQQQQQHNNIKRDAATAMYIFERLLAKRTNPDLEDRVQVLKILAEISIATFSGKYAIEHKIGNSDDYAEAMAMVFGRHGLKIYSVILDILFRPVREADANRIGIFSFHEAGIIAAGATGPDATATDDLMNGGAMVVSSKRKGAMMEFPRSAICLPNMECTAEAASTSNALMKLFMNYVPGMCTQRMALITGTINSAFLYCSEALITNNYNHINIHRRGFKYGNGKCRWDMEKLKRATDALDVLVKAVPNSVDSALELIVREPVTLRLVIETCIRSVSATGRLMAQNAARYSASRVSDEGTLDSLRSWQKLVKILPRAGAWSGTPSYSSSILFLAQVARRAALIEVVKEYRKNKSISTAATGGKENGKGGVGGKEGMPVEEEDPNDDSFEASKNEAGTEQNHGVLAEQDEMEVENVSSRQYGGDGNRNENKEGDDEGDGLDEDEENVLVMELHQSIIDMINVPGTSPGDIFFELYRTVVYLYANDLKKQAKASMKQPVSTERDGPSDIKLRKSSGGTSVAGTAGTGTITSTMGMANSDSNASGGRGPAGLNGSRTQSDEDARGILVENIAVDGQLPSRALRRAVMASELDLGEYFSDGIGASADVSGSEQPPSLQHLNQYDEYRGVVPLGVHTFEEFAHALAIIIGTLSNSAITENFENPQEATAMIARDVLRSGSSYLKKVHRRAKVIMRKDIATREIDWQAVKYEERIKKLEEQVASLKSLVELSLEAGGTINATTGNAPNAGMQIGRRGSLTKILTMCGGGERERVGRNDDEVYDTVCGPTKCFCVG